MTTVHDRPRVRGELPRTSVAETVRVAATALAPVVARGVPARRPRVVALAEWRTGPADQVPQWLFAFEPAGMAAFRALGLLATHPEQAKRAYDEIAGHDPGTPDPLPYLRACVPESVRLWPTTLVPLRESTTETEWDGGVLPAGTGLIMPTPFLQRDEVRRPYADVFTPRIWLDGTARANWQLVPFGGGPAECQGRNLVQLVTSLFLAGLPRGHEYRQVGGRSPAAGRPLPRTQSPFRLRLGARPRVC